MPFLPPVQKAISPTNANATGTCNWPGATTLGNHLVLTVSVSGGSSTTINTPAGWTVGPTIFNGVNVRIATFYIENSASRSGTQSVTFSSAVDSVVSLAEYSGVAKSASLGATNTNTGSSSTPSSGTITTQAPNSLLVAVLCGVAVAAFPPQSSPTGGFTLEQTAQAGLLTFVDVGYLDKAAGAVGSETATDTAGASLAWAGAILEFKATPTPSPLKVLVAHRKTRAQVLAFAPGSGTSVAPTPPKVLVAKYLDASMQIGVRRGRAQILRIPPKHAQPIPPIIARQRPPQQRGVPRGAARMLPVPPRHYRPATPILIVRGPIFRRGKAIFLPPPPKSAVVSVYTPPQPVKVARGPRYKFPGMGHVVMPFRIFGPVIGLHSLLAAIVNEDALTAVVGANLAAIVDDGPHLLTTGARETGGGGGTGPGGGGTGAGGGSGGGSGGPDGGAAPGGMPPDSGTGAGPCPDGSPPPCVPPSEIGP